MFIFSKLSFTGNFVLKINGKFKTIINIFIKSIACDVVSVVAISLEYLGVYMSIGDGRKQKVG